MKKSPDTPPNDLFDRLIRGEETQETEQVWSVSRLSNQIKRIVEDGIPLLWVEGEISNYKLHSSGHRYFTLKDDAAQLSCVMWRTRASSVPTIQDGMKVRLFGRVTVWEQAGKYQFDVQNLLPVGIGDLQKTFELLKNRLAAEGLFASDRKKQLPRFPKRIGIVTSPTGAVIHDLVWGLTSRFPPVKIFLVPVAVQGEGAAGQIADAISLLDSRHLVDVIIIGRGGGSLEDLWAFNEEVVVRAVARCATPVVSAVGHEVDVTLSDFAADLRAPTPTAAAALIVPDRRDLLEHLLKRGETLSSQLHRSLALWQERLLRIGQSYSFKRLPARISDERLHLDEIARRQEMALGRCLSNRKSSLDSLLAKIEALSPISVLGRGYSVVRAMNGSVIRSSGEIELGERLLMLFAAGNAVGTVESINE